MNFYDTKIATIGPFEVVGTGNPRDSVGLRDRSGRWVISPEKGYQSFSHYEDGLMIAYFPAKDGYGWVLVDYHGNCVSDRFNYIKPAGEGYYMVEKGAHCNIMRRDGTCVLKESPHRVGEVRDGYFSIGKTIRKTGKTPTRYLSGVAHVSGIVVFPMIFDSVDFIKDSADILVEKDGRSFIIHNGALYDRQKNHYPPKIQSDEVGKCIEKIVNWILPGLQLYYRDTDLPIDVESMYPIGKVLRTGFYASFSTKLLKPAHKTRFLIAAAHVAYMCSYPDGSENKLGLSLSPCADLWRHVVLHKNTWLKVLDVYRVGDITQVFMIQIPETVAKLFGDNNIVFDFINSAGGNGTTLIELARESLNDKIRQGIHPRSMDAEWVKIMHRLVGYDMEGKAYSIEPDLLFDDDFSEWEELSGRSTESYFSRIVHKLADDMDIVQDYGGFPWRGLVGSVCEGCMYAKGSNGKPFGCGRLFIDSFRKSYTNGKCDYWKACLQDESAFESQARREREYKSKVTGVYAKDLLSAFISDYLDGNIDNIVTFDFATLENDNKYGAIKGPRKVVNYAIVKAIAEVVFGEYWPDLNVETLDKYQYQVGTLIHYQFLVGPRIADRHFKFLNLWFSDESLVDMAEDLHNKSGRIGNFMVWPDKANLACMFETPAMGGYIDQLFIAIYHVMMNFPQQNKDVKAALWMNRKMIKDYQGEIGFASMMKNSLLDDFLNDDMATPKRLFDGFSNAAKDCRPELLPSALRQYHDIMCPFIENRSNRMLSVLKRKLTKG